MTAGLTPTEAFLSVAAATTRAEMHAARLALIGTGAGVLTDLDTTEVVSGDGTAGQHLLAGVGRHGHDHLAQRAARLQVRLLGQLVRTTVRTGQDGHTPTAMVLDEIGGAP